MIALFIYDWVKKFHSVNKMMHFAVWNRFGTSVWFHSTAVSTTKVVIAGHIRRRSADDNWW